MVTAWPILGDRVIPVIIPQVRNGGPERKDTPQEPSVSDTTASTFDPSYGFFLTPPTCQFFFVLLSLVTDVY